MFLQFQNLIKRSRTIHILQRSLFNEVQFHDVKQPLVRIRGQKFMPGFESNNLPEYLTQRWSKYVKILQCDPSLQKETLGIIGKEAKKVVDESFKSTNHSAIYLKNLDIKTSDDFAEFIQGLDLLPMSYETGTGFREKVQEYVYFTSNEPDVFSIEPHNEMSYLDRFPRKIIICCLEPAREGGESPIVFNRELQENMDPSYTEMLQKRGIRYYRNVQHQNNTDYISWQMTFETTEREVAEERMKSQSMNWEWQSNGDVTIWYYGNVFINHPETGEEIWFNQMTSNHYTYYSYHPKFEGRRLSPFEYPAHCTYGDGEEIEDEFIDYIRASLWKSAIPVKLDAGDVLILDNLLAQHSKTGYQGGTRRLLVNLSEPMTIRSGKDTE